MAIFTGSTLHEVAHVVGAGNAMNDTILAGSAAIVKMIRIILLAPFLILLSFLVSKKNNPDGSTDAHSGKKTFIPWFVIGFLVAIIVNSLLPLPNAVVKGIERADAFALTMAMTAIGIESNFSKFRQAGAKPFILAAILFAWLIGVGYLLARYLVPALR